MNPKELGQLILYIVYQVGDLGGYTTTIRLVKFLYLIDYEYYRRYGKTLTGLKWYFHFYGPYAFELPEICQRLGFNLEQEEFNSIGGTGRIFRVNEPQTIPNEIGYSTESMINGLMYIWGDQGTKELLSYVYQTEPILKGTRGQVLNFSLVEKGSGYYELNIPVDKKIVNKIREDLKVYSEEELNELSSPNIKSRFVSPEMLHDFEENENFQYFGIPPIIPDEKVVIENFPEEG